MSADANIPTAGQNDTDAGQGMDTVTQDQSQNQAPDQEGQGNSLLTGGDAAQDQGPGKAGEQVEGSKDDGAKDGKDAEGAPEEYADFTLPEGMEMETALLDEAKPLFKELNASQGQAQKLMDMAAKLVAQGAEKAQAAQVDAWKSQVKAWEGEMRADKELGGSRLPETLTVAKKGLRMLDPKGEATKLLDELGLGSHPAVVRLFHRAGVAVSEDAFVEGSKGVRQDSVVHGVGQFSYPSLKKD